LEMRTEVGERSRIWGIFTVDWGQRHRSAGRNFGSGGGYGCDVFLSNYIERTEKRTSECWYGALSASGFWISSRACMRPYLKINDFHAAGVFRVDSRRQVECFKIRVRVPISRQPSVDLRRASPVSLGFLNWEILHSWHNVERAD